MSVRWGNARAMNLAPRSALGVTHLLLHETPRLFASESKRRRGARSRRRRRTLEPHQNFLSRIQVGANDFLSDEARRLINEAQVAEAA